MQNKEKKEEKIRVGGDLFEMFCVRVEMFLYHLLTNTSKWPQSYIYIYIVLSLISLKSKSLNKN